MAASPESDRSRAMASCVHRGRTTGSTEPAAGPIVVGVDGTAGSLGAVRWAVQEALLRQARVHLVFVSRQYGRAPYPGPPEASPAGEGGPNGPAVLAAAELAAARALPPGRVSSELARGSPAQVLIDRSAGAELLVLGNAYPPGHSASEAPPMGLIARACLDGAACPVVVVAA